VRILADHGANLWLRNSKGGYPLHDAMRSGRKELVLWLISMRPESVDYYDDDGKRPLHIAALNNNLEMSKVDLHLFLYLHMYTGWYIESVYIPFNN
jgi:ankyrin repeat protein